MPGQTPRLALPYPVPNDVPDGAAQIKALADKLDPVTPTDTQGAVGARPAAGTAGRYYFATDEHKLYRDNGTGWEYVAAGSPTAVPVLDGTASRRMTGPFSPGVVGLGGGSPYAIVPQAHGLGSTNVTVLGALGNNGNAAMVMWAWVVQDANTVNIHYRNLNPNTPWTGAVRFYVMRDYD